MSNNMNLQTSFFQALKFFYDTNKKSIQKNYKDLTKKYLMIKKIIRMLF